MYSNDMSAILTDKSSIEGLVDTLLATLTAQSLDDATDFDLVSRTLTAGIVEFNRQAMHGQEITDDTLTEIAAEIRYDWSVENDMETDQDSDADF